MLFIVFSVIGICDISSQTSCCPLGQNDFTIQNEIDCCYKIRVWYWKASPSPGGWYAVSPLANGPLNHCYCPSWYPGIYANEIDIDAGSQMFPTSQTWNITTAVCANEMKFELVYNCSGSNVYSPPKATVTGSSLGPVTFYEPNGCCPIDGNTMELDCNTNTVILKMIGPTCN